MFPPSGKGTWVPKPKGLESCPERRRQTGGGGVEGRVDSQRRKEAERQMDREGQRDVGERSRREGA